MKPTQDVVYELLELIATVPAGGILPTHELVRDLKVDGDDYGMWLVPELKKRLGINATRREWEIRTVAELLAVAERAVERASSNNGAPSA